jgi:hypothetical protein
MDQNKDWKPVAALVLAGLALFVALSGARGRDNDYVSTVPQQIIVQPAPPAQSQNPGVPGGAIVLPASVPAEAAHSHTWGAWRGGWPAFPLFPLLFVAGLIFLALKVFGRRGWGGPGWYGRPWGGPGPGPQAPPNAPPYQHPYQQYPPQYAQGQGQQQGQPYGGYPQGQQPQQGQPTQATDTHGDITRPEGRD